MISDKMLKAAIAAANGNETGDEIIRGALLELQERRETELRPATKFVKKLDFYQQLNHVKSEIKEIEGAYEKYKFKGNKPDDFYDLLDEITDAQHSLQTLKAVVNVSQSQDIDSYRRVNWKNEARGYYDE